MKITTFIIDNVVKQGSSACFVMHVVISPNIIDKLIGRKEQSIKIIAQVSHQQIVFLDNLSGLISDLIKDEMKKDIRVQEAFK